MDRGTWGATVHGVAQSWMQLKQLPTHTGRFDEPQTLMCSIISINNFIAYTVPFLSTGGRIIIPNQLGRILKNNLVNGTMQL